MVTNAECERGKRSNCDGFQPVRVGPQSSAAGQLHSEPRPSGGETASVPAPSPTAETEPHPTTAATAEDRDDRHLMQINSLSLCGVALRMNPACKTDGNELTCR